MSRYSAVLDTSVLVPIALADTLLRLAERELYRPLWSDEILAELEEAIVEVHPDIDTQAVQRRIGSMRLTFEDACIVGWESISVTGPLPDPGDAHVIAAAIRGRADAIVTANTRHFPPEALKGFDIVAITPDDFLLDQLDLAPRIVVGAIQELAAHTSNPPLEVIDVLVRLERSGAPSFADEVRRLI
ncbi:MAG TPA: PIN domain-containing protein [Acidimicrobiales bacterium]|nr:PIN domain-containing protein [Acidimicrobiales bacterium]